ncbi:cyclin-J18 [Pyrus ussuriensis x Pyrus communis]|uniref:Cyclin-J18 n=1 Tax=Pyrus ussuriensis x Pyrus communis TaxID=2448454 RepID=A0A5N5HB26_9ROSA|nr:cyclin-J18 [Pyrus ussuriensis x Pyrus communis]
MNNIAFGHFEELLPQFKVVAKVGEVVNFDAGIEIIDILYEKKSRRHRCSTPILAPSLYQSWHVASYIITAPKQMLEFPVLPWVEFVTRCDEEDVLDLVTDILKHVFDACR